MTPKKDDPMFTLIPESDDSKKRDRRLNDARLIAIESKIDKLSEAMLTLVRMEERMMFQAKTIEKLEKKVNHLEAQKDELRDTVQEARVKESGTHSRSLMVERIIWAAISTAIGFIGYSIHAPEVPL